MIFDEAIKILGKGVLTDNVNFGDSTFVSKREITNLDAIQIINDLRQEYAPTIEMTKEQYKAFVESVEGLATQKQLDSFVDEELDLGDMTVRRGLNAWLHPETIKIKG